MLISKSVDVTTAVSLPDRCTEKLRFPKLYDACLLIGSGVMALSEAGTHASVDRHAVHRPSGLDRPELLQTALLQLLSAPPKPAVRPTGIMGRSAPSPRLPASPHKG